MRRGQCAVGNVRYNVLCARVLRGVCCGQWAVCAYCALCARQGALCAVCCRAQRVVRSVPRTARLPRRMPRCVEACTAPAAPSRALCCCPSRNATRRTCLRCRSTGPDPDLHSSTDGETASELTEWRVVLGCADRGAERAAARARRPVPAAGARRAAAGRRRQLVRLAHLPVAAWPACMHANNSKRGTSGGE